MYIADDNYLALDLVLNAAGEGLILAFFHAIVGKSSLSLDASFSREEDMC